MIETSVLSNQDEATSQSRKSGLPYGSLVAVVTPMNAQGDILWSDFEDLIEWHIASNTQAIVVAGTTGECATFSIDEQALLFQKAVSVAKGRICIIGGAGSNCTTEAIELSLAAASAGVDAVLSVVPYYNKPSQEGIYQHFKAQADAVDVPLILYNVPSRCASDLSHETVLRLAMHDNIVGLKDATGDLNRVQQCLAALATASIDKEFRLYSGDDMSSLAFMRLGGHGCISVTANIKPVEMSTMCQLALDGQWASAAVIDQSLQFWHKNLFIESSPAPAKYALWQLQRITTPELRLPLVRLSQASAKILDQ